MSLQVEERRRGRSRSPGGRERERSRSRGPPVDDDDGPGGTVPYPDDRDRGQRIYDYEDRYGERHERPRSPVDDSSYRQSRESVDVHYSDGHRDKEYRYEKETTHQRSDRGGDPRLSDDKLSYLPPKYASAKADSGPARRYESSKYDDDDDDDENLRYGSGIPPQGSRRPRADSPPEEADYEYAKPKQWEYAKVEEKVTYNNDGTRSSRDSLAVETRRGAREPSLHRGSGAYGGDPARVLP